MITVKLLGGAKKSLSVDKLEIEKDEITVIQLIDVLQEAIPSNMPKLDIENLLVAINGVDSSTLQGFATQLKNGDVITIIPIIHGGEIRRKCFRIFKTAVEVMRITAINDPVKFLERQRVKYPNLIIQGIKSSYVLNEDHAKKVITISLTAKKNNTMLSNKLETDILMRFACTRQINDAIHKVGLQAHRDFFLITIGKKSSIDKLFSEIRSSLKKKIFLDENSHFLKKEFAITTKHLTAISSNTPLEDLLAEKASVLFR